MYIYIYIEFRTQIELRLIVLCGVAMWFNYIWTWTRIVCRYSSCVVSAGDCEGGLAASPSTFIIIWMNAYECWRLNYIVSLCVFLVYEHIVGPSVCFSFKRSEDNYTYIQVWDTVEFGIDFLCILVGLYMCDCVQWIYMESDGTDFQYRQSAFDVISRALVPSPNTN